MAFYIPYFVGASMASYLTKHMYTYMSEEGEINLDESSNNNIKDNTFLKLSEEPIILESIPEDIEINENKEVIEPKEEVVIEPTEEVIEPTEEVIEPKEEEVIEPTEEVIEPKEEEVIEPKEEEVVEPTEEVIEPKEEEVIEPKEEVVEPKEEEVIEPKEEVVEPKEEVVEKDIYRGNGTIEKANLETIIEEPETPVVQEIVYCSKCSLYLPKRCFSKNQFKKYSKVPKCKICTKLK